MCEVKFHFERMLAIEIRSVQVLGIVKLGRPAPILASCQQQKVHLVTIDKKDPTNDHLLYTIHLQSSRIS